MFVIAGVTGNTGGAAARALIAAKVPVRVVVRREEQGAEWAARGAEVAVARLDDPLALAKALEGASGAYLLTPPDLAHPAVQARGRRFAEGYVEALTRSPVPHVAFLSSVGAQHADGTGPIAMLHYAEERLRTLSRTRFTFLRAAYFVDNIANNFHPARAQGVLPALFTPSKEIEMVSAPDIGEAAARALLDPAGATRSWAVVGPETYSYDRAAALLSTLLAKPVKALHVPREAVVPALTGVGLSEDAARSFLELAVGIDEGRVAYAGDEQLVRGKTGPEVQLTALLARR